MKDWLRHILLYQLMRLHIEKARNDNLQLMSVPR